MYEGHNPSKAIGTVPDDDDDDDDDESSTSCSQHL